MAPSIFFVLFWRIGMQLLYPFRYTNRSVQDALGDDYMPWVYSDRSQIEQVIHLLLRQVIESSLIFVLIMEFRLSIHGGRNVPLML